MGKVTVVSSHIESLPPIDPSKLAAFVRTMTEKVIPEIVADIENRQVLARKSRESRVNS